MEPDAVCRIVFLDIDGVLNTFSDSSSCSHDPNASPALCEANVRNLKHILGTVHHCSIILTSTWRTDQRAMNALSAAIAGATPDLAGMATRSQEILVWLREHVTSEHSLHGFVVLDDQALTAERGGDLLADRFVHVDGSHGLSEQDAERAIALLQVDDAASVRKWVDRAASCAWGQKEATPLTRGGGELLGRDFFVKRDKRKSKKQEDTNSDG